MGINVKPSPKVYAIIVEGMDHSGKSTLVKELANHFKEVPGLATFKSQRPLSYQDWQSRIFTQYVQTLGNQEIIHIYDRISLVSEPVYSSALARVSTLSMEEISRGWQLLRAMYDNIAFVLCTHQSPNLGEKPEMEGVIEHQTDIRQAYMIHGQYLQNSQRQEVIVYDYELRPFSYLLDRVSTSLRRPHAQ